MAELFDEPDYVDLTDESDATPYAEVDQFTPQQAQSLTAKTMLGFGTKPIDPAQVYQGYMDANVGMAQRDQEATAYDAEQSQIKQDLINQYVTQKSNSSEPINRGDIAYINSLTKQELSNPDAIFEKMYGKQVVNLSQILPTNSKVEEAIEDDGDKAADEMNAAARHLATREAISKYSMQINNRVQKMKGLDKWSNVAESVLPFLSSYRQTNLIGQHDWSMLGSNKEQQYQQLYLMGPDAAIAKIKEIGETLFTQNPYDAQNFVNGALSYGASDKAIDQAISIGDYAAVGDIAALGAVVAKSGTAITSSLKQTLKSTAKSNLRPSEVKAAVGDLPGAAADEIMAKSINPATSGKVDAASLNDLYMQTPMYQNPEAVVEGGSSTLSAAQLQALKQNIEAQQAALIKGTIVDGANIERLNDPTLQAVALEENRRVFNKQYYRAEEAVIDAEFIPGGQSVANIDYARYRIGTQPVQEARTAGKASATVSSPRLGKNGQKRLLESANDDGFTVVGFEDFKKDQTVFLKGKDGVLIPHKYLGEELVEEGAERMALVDVGLPEPARVPMSQLESNLVPKVETQATLKAAGKNPLAPKGKTTAKAVSDNYAIKVGNPGKELFDTEEAAIRAAKEDYGFVDYTVKQQGNGWYIEVIKAIDETTNRQRGQWAIVTKNQTPDSLTGFVGKFFRSANYTMPTEVMQVMNNSVIQANARIKMLGSIADTLPKLGKQPMKEMNEFFRAQQALVDPVTKQTGKFSRSVVDMEQDFFKIHNKFPTEAQIGMYFAARNFSDAEYMARNLAWARDLNRLGLENHSFPINVNGGVIDSGQIQGKFLTDWPEPDLLRDAGVYVVDKDQHFFSRFKTKEDLDALKKEYQLINVTKYGEDALRNIPGFGETIPGNKISYILVKDVKSSKLPMNAIPYREGLHVEYPDLHKLVQPRIRTRGERQPKSYLGGDFNIAALKTPKEAKMWQKRYEDAFEITRRLESDPDNRAIKKELANYLSKNMPYSYKSWYSKAIGPNKVFDIHAPIGTVRSGSTYDSTYNIESLLDSRGSQRYPNVLRASDDPHEPLNQSVNFKFAMERGEPLSDISSTGSASNPVYKFVPTDTVNPLDSLSRITQATMRDKTSVIDSKLILGEWFTSEFSELLDDGVSRQLRMNPFEQVVNPTWKVGAEKNPKWQSAKKFSQVAKEVLGMKTEQQRTFDIMRQKLGDNLADTYGYETFKTFDDWADFFSRNDPVTASKKLAWHSKLGLFNPIQFFKQSQTLVHMTGIVGPKNAYDALGVAYYLRAASRAANPGVVDNLAEKASAWGVSKKDFHEMVTSYVDNFAYHKVGREVSLAEGFEDTNLVQSRLGKFLDAGAVFYNAGEEAVRGPAFAAAYKEWRTANAGAAFDNVAQQKVINRAILLGVDMTTASNASWQRGIMGVPTQFFAYQTRLMEQLLGKRLTTAEKFRVLGTYSAVYGVPVAATAATGIWPWHESLRQEMLDRGMNSDNVAISAVQNGVMQAMTGVIFGEEYTTAQDYGPSGLSFLKDFLAGDKSALEMLSGVSGSSTFGYIQALSPLASTLIQTASGDEDGIPVTVSDVHDVLNNISTVNNATKMYMAMTAHKFFDKQGRPVADADAWDGMMVGVFGLQPRAVQEWYDMQRISISDKKEQDEIRKYVTKQYQLAARANADEDKLKFYKRAQIAMRAVPVQDRMPLLRSAHKGYEDRILKDEARFAQKSKARMEAYQRNNTNQ